MTVAGETLANRYRVLAPLGEGAMGVVWRAVDTHAADREVAVKVIKGAQGERERLRFKGEFRAMARLRHPNTVEVHDYGLLDDGRPYIVMALVPGQELGELIAGRPVPFDRLYPLLIQLLQALDFVHARGYVHRDIKSQNIRVRDDGSLMLMDFGLVGQAGERGAGLTGTPGYLAPELVQQGEATPASDLYAVGCLAYELLTGHLPFQGTMIEMLRAHVGQAPPPLRPLRADVPEALERLVMRLLEKSPARRPRSAGQVLAALVPLAGVALTRQRQDQRLGYLEAGEIVGREAEVRVLEAALAETIAGRGRAIAVLAPAGTGKSRLVGELALQAKLADCLVLEATGEAGSPRATLARALRPLLPELAVETDVVATLAEAAARQPVLLLLEDLHAADLASVESFHRLAHGLRGHPVLVVATFRDDETLPGSPVWRALEDGTAEPLRLDPLDRAGQAALLRAMLPEADVPETFLAALDGACGGNAFLLGEVLRALMEDGFLGRSDAGWRFPADLAVLRPLASVEATLRRRLAHLSPGARALLEVAAVLGHHWDAMLLGKVGQLADDALFEQLDELVERQFLLRAHGQRYRFAHDRVREVAYAGLNEACRRALHGRAGAAIETCHEGRLQDVVGDLAHHHFRAGDAARAYRYLMTAAAHADAAGADEVALVRFQEAAVALEDLDIPDKTAHQIRLWYQTAWHAAISRPELARRCLARALPALAAAPDAGEAAGVAEGHLHAANAVATGMAGYPREAMAAAAAAAALPPFSASPDAAAYARLLGLLAAGRIDEVIATARVADAAFVAMPTGIFPFGVHHMRTGTLTSQNAVAFQGVRPDPVLRDMALAQARLNRDEDPYTVWMYFGLWPAWTGRRDEALAYVERMTDKARRVGGPPFPWVLYIRPYLLWQHGDHETALAQVEKALIAFPHLRENALAFHHMLALRGHLFLGLGRHEEATVVFADLEALARERELGLALLLALTGRGMVALAAGHPSEARTPFAEAHALTLAGPLRNPLYQARAARGLGQVLMALGDRDGAEERLAEALAIVRRPEQDNLLLQAHLHRDRGRLARRQGDRARAVAELGRAAELFAAQGNGAWQHAVALDLAEFQVAVPAVQPTLEARMQRLRGLLD